MKKVNNIILLIGIIFLSIFIVIKILDIAFSSTGEFFDEYIRYNIIYNKIIPTVIVLLTEFLAIFLFVRNLKKKSGNLIPIICMLIYGFIGLWMLFGLLTPSIPQYIVYSKLGLVDTYFLGVMTVISGGKVFTKLGYLLLLVGSVMSLNGKKNNNAKTGDEK